MPSIIQSLTCNQCTDNDSRSGDSSQSPSGAIEMLGLVGSAAHSGSRFLRRLMDKKGLDAYFYPNVDDMHLQYNLR